MIIYSDIKPKPIRLALEIKDKLKKERKMEIEEKQVIQLEEVKKNPKAEVTISNEGFMQATTIEGQMRIARAMIESKMVPRSYETAAQVMIAMQFALEMGLKPIQGLRNIAVINGNPSIWGELPLALARKTGQLEYIKEILLDKDYNVICLQNKNLTAPAWIAVCQMKRKNEPEVETFFTMDDAKRAGLLDRKNTTPWDTYTKIMLSRRARSQALKIAFADSLSSISIAEYDNNYIPDAGDMKEVSYQGEEVVDKAKQLNELF